MLRTKASRCARQMPERMREPAQELARILRLRSWLPRSWLPRSWRPGFWRVLSSCGRPAEHPPKSAAGRAPRRFELVLLDVRQHDGGPGRRNVMDRRIGHLFGRPGRRIGRNADMRQLRRGLGEFLIDRRAAGQTQRRSRRQGKDHGRQRPRSDLLLQCDGAPSHRSPTPEPDSLTAQHWGER